MTMAIEYPGDALKNNSSINNYLLQLSSADCRSIEPKSAWRSANDRRISTVPIVQPFSTARTYFEHIKSQPDPFAFLADIPSPPRSDPFFEEEWLDFKGRPQDDRDAKKIWSKALSGYANITDGLVIWGIDARRTPPREIDAACGLRLLSDPQAFESRLRDWIRDATNPPVMGVEYQTYANTSQEGFVVCLIPESAHKPHRAEYADKHYYFRASDDFLIAEPGLLRMLFSPQNHPYIWVDVTLRFQLNPTDMAKAHREQPTPHTYNKLINNTSSMSFDILLHNTGTATAKDGYVVVQASDDLNYHQGTDWDIRQNPQGQAAFQARRPIHPGEVTELFSATFQKPFANTSGRSPNSWEIKPYFNKVYLQFIVYADNFSRQEIAVEFTPDDLDFKSGSATKQVGPAV